MARNGVTLGCAIRAPRLAADPGVDDHHIASCLRCQVEAVRYRTLLRQLSALRAVTVDAPAGLLAVVRSGLGEEPPVPKKGSGVEAAVAAAGLAAVAGAVAIWRRSLSA